MLETNIPDYELPPIQEVPVVNHRNSDKLGRALLRMDDESFEHPAFKVDAPPVPPGYMNRDVAGSISQRWTQQYGGGYRVFYEKAEPRISSQKHQDGAIVSPFAQIHTAFGPAETEAIYDVLELTPDMQKDLLKEFEAFQGKQPAYDKPHQFPIVIGGEAVGSNVAERFSPTVLTYAPIVARFRVHLDQPGQSVVFRNGFNVFDLRDQPKRIMMHDFHSLDRKGSPVYSSAEPDSALIRNFQVSYVLPVGKDVATVEEEPKRRSLLRRRKAA